MPELLQGDATPERAGRTPRWPGSTTRRAATRCALRFEALHHELRRNTAQAATDAIEKVLAG